MDLDRYDRQLLNLVQEDSGQTAERLAEQEELSPSAIQRRLRRLRDVGVIVRDCAIVDPAVVGRPEFLSWWPCRWSGSDPIYWPAVGRMAGASSQEPQVQQAFYATERGGFQCWWSRPPNNEAYEALMSRMMRENPNIRRYTTNVALGVLKRGLTLPVPSES